MIAVEAVFSDGDDDGGRGESDEMDVGRKERTVEGEREGDDGR